MMDSGAKLRQGRCRTYEELLAFAEQEGYANPSGYALRILEKRAAKAAAPCPLFRGRPDGPAPRWGNPGYDNKKRRET